MTELKIETRGGKRLGAGRPKNTGPKGKKINIEIYHNNIEFFYAIPDGKKSWVFNQAIEEYIKARPDYVEFLKKI